MKIGQFQVNKVLTFFLILLQVINNEEEKKKAKSWCWTKPVKKSEEASINPEKGGSNWGFCAVQGPAKKEKAPYRVFVETPNIKSAGATGQFYITMFGEEGYTDEILLTSSGFMQGSTTIVKFQANNIGDVNKIRIRNGGNQKYKCAKVRIEYGSKFWDFDCQNWLQCPKKCFEDLDLTGNQRYVVNVQTSSKPDSGSKDAIYIEFFGVDGKTNKKILSETGFAIGEVKQIMMQNNDVGLIYGIKICSEGSDSWAPETISILRAGSESSEFDPKGQKVGCPSSCCLTIKNPKPGDEESSDSESGGGGGGGGGGGDAGGGGTDTADPNTVAKGVGGKEDDEQDPNQLLNDYSGASLTAFEKQKMVDLGCDDMIKGNEDFGPSFSNNVPNFEMVIAKCPPGCYKVGSQGVFGLSIHNEESSICKSAVVDGASPLSGGIIGIGIVQGIDKYEKGGVIQGIEVKSGSKSKRSMFTFKIDNIDFADKDMRILDNEGQPSFKGRLEVRVNGKWGTICSKGTTDKIGRGACRMLKFLDGQLKNPPSTEGGSDFCSAFEGQDYCGYEPQPIHFMGVQCEGAEQKITDCYREMAQDCTHMDDVVIECSNINFDTPQEPDKGTIRMVDENGSPAMSGIGRMEVYQGQWMTMCNTKFNPKGANVICKQMGYESGELIGNPGQNGVCTNYNGKNFCGEGKIAMKDINCQGEELKLKQCASVLNPADCSHEQDLMLKCLGAGDPSGKSQKTLTNPLGPPPLGKLPLPPILGAKCTTTLMEKVFRGDPGSIYLVNCPPGCSESKGSVWGTGIYSADSSICRAAIHAGVNQDFGGLILVIKGYGQSQYFGSTRRTIATSAYSKQPYSFLISRPNSIAVKLVKMYEESKSSKSSFIQIYNPMLTYTQRSILSYSPQSLFEKRTNKMSYDKLNHVLRFTSFIETDEKSKNMVTKQPEIFKWTPPNPGYKFNGKDSIIKTEGLPGAEKTRSLAAFSFVLQAQMIKQPDKIQTLIGHSGCNGYALLIDPQNEIIFKARCTENEFKTGYRMPLDQTVHIVITYDKQFIIAYFDANLYNKEKKAFNFKCDKQFDIGSYSDVQDQIFNGEIDYVVVYDYPLSEGEILKLKEKGVPADPKGHQVGMRFTADQRLCLTPCTTNPPPGEPGNSGPPGDAAPGKPDYGPGNDIQEGIEETEEQGPVEMPANGLSLELNCDTTGEDKRLQGPTGKQFRVKCPKMCHISPLGNVIGTQIYTDMSSVCKAAIHSGIIDREKEGEMMVVISNGESYYQGSFQNEIQSASFGESLRSITFKVALPIQRVACKDTLAQSKFNGKPGQRYVVKCPKDCSKEEQEVFGDGVYTDDSKICQAGIHAGLLTDKGGELEIAVEEGQKKYVGKIKNGINSIKRDNHIRSFKLIGDKSLTCEYFAETYNPANIYNNWKMEDAKGAQQGPSDWMFNTNPTDASLCIQQMSKITGSQYNYGTSLIRKEFDCNDYVLKVNVYFEVLSQAIIIFRYSDPNNFYSLEININGQKPLVLAKKVEAIGTSIAEADFALVPKTWYRFRIMMAEDQLEVWSQTGQLRNLQKIMEVKDEDNQKGTVGLATDGDAQVSFDGVEVSAYEKLVGVFDKYSDYKPNWDVCLQGTTQAARKKFCKKLFGTFQAGLDKCVHLYNFCNTCCDYTIPKILNIYNFACYKECINEAKALERRKNQEKLAQMEAEAILNNKWRPQEGEKVDYKPSVLGDSSYFVPAKIDSIDINHKNAVIPEEQKLKIKFFIDGKENIEEVLYPNKILTKCGESLQARTDCAD